MRCDAVDQDLNQYLALKPGRFLYDAAELDAEYRKRSVVAKHWSRFDSTALCKTKFTALIRVLRF